MSDPGPNRVSRRRFLVGLAGLVPIAIEVACSSSSASPATVSAGVATSDEAPTPTPSPAPVPPPFIVAEGEDRRLLMAGTPQETPLYIYGSGRPGKVLMVLGGVHGNEPGGWLAADRLVTNLRPTEGALLIVPHANKQAMAAFVRTTDQLGDLNRYYPGDPNSSVPMARMAFEITEAIREFHVSNLVDMHESWAFYNDRPQNGTAFLGQTIASNVTDAAVDLADSVVAAVNSRIQAPWEEFFYRNRQNNGSNGPPPGAPSAPGPTVGNPNANGQGSPASGGVNSSSLGIPRTIPDLTVFLVEMGQQQALERRIALHIDITNEVARRIGVLT